MATPDAASLKVRLVKLSIVTESIGYSVDPSTPNTTALSAPVIEDVNPVPVTVNTWVDASITAAAAVAKV